MYTFGIYTSKVRICDELDRGWWEILLSVR